MSKINKYRSVGSRFQERAGRVVGNLQEDSGTGQGIGEAWKERTLEYHAHGNKEKMRYITGDLTLPRQWDKAICKPPTDTSNNHSH
jgi:hypothetical protein